MRDADLFAFDDLEDVWHDPDGSALTTYTIITTAANEVVAPIHDRMPAILRWKADERRITSDPPEQEELRDLLGPYPAPDVGGVSGIGMGQQPGIGRPGADRAAREGVNRRARPRTRLACRPRPPSRLARTGLMGAEIHAWME